MKTLSIIVLLIHVFTTASTQSKQLIRKSWIRIASEDLSGKHNPIDSSYARYSFEKTNLNISLEPAWGFITRDWKLDKERLTIGRDIYTIELLTDSTLTISIPGFKRFTFLSENYLSSQDKYLEKIGEFESKPLYNATKFISPRFSDTKSFQILITSNMEQHYQIKRKSLLLATFIITDKGEVKSITIEKGIYDDYNEDIVKEIAKTSKKWTPAYFKGKPIQTKFTFKIQYLDSLSPY